MRQNQGDYPRLTVSYYRWQDSKAHVCVLSPVQLFENPWTVAFQDSLSIRFSRQEYWSGLPCPLPGYLPAPGIEPGSPVFPASAGGFFTTSASDRHPLVPSQSDLPPCPSPPSVFSQSNRIQMAVRGALKLKTHSSRLSIRMSWFRQVL